MKPILALLLSSTLVFSAETQFTTSAGKVACLYTPSEKADTAKTYWLAIGIDSLNPDGKGAGGLEKWVADDVIVMGASLPTTDERLTTMIAEVSKTWRIRPKVFLHGFGEGAQVVHQFVMKHPEMVAGVSIASAESWGTKDFGESNPAASTVPFAMSCGEYDHDKPNKDSALGRVEWMEAFAKTLREAHFDVEACKIPNVGHKVTPAAMALAEACFKRARVLNFSPSVMIACDFSELNPLWAISGEATGKATTAHATWDADVGVIEKQGTSERTGALRLRVNSAAASWNGTLHTGLLPVSCPEKDLNKLTLAFDLSATSVRAVRVSITSYNAKHERSGIREGLIYPAAPEDYQRHVLDLGMMKPTSDGDFKATDPWVQVSLTISDELGWATGAFHQLRLDNLSYAAPALYVSPNGKDSSGRGTADKPLATLNRALAIAQPGDIILMMDGIFVRKNAIEFPRGGSPAAWITLRNHPGQKPVLTCPDWNILKIGKGNVGKVSDDPALSYIELRGLTVRGVGEEVEAKYKSDIGKPKGSTNGNGIGIDGRYQKNKPHHIRIADNEVLQCPGGGISVIHADYVQVENNLTHNNCHWMIYAGSGISLYQAFNFDTSTSGHKMLVRNNVAHHNYCTQPWIVTGKPSDGNGIIVDDMQNHQNKSSNGVYRGGILIQGNLSYDNGGSGMHSYASDHIDFINNTVANNSTVNDYGQLSITACGHVRMLNNILVAAKDKPLNRVNGDYHDVLLSHNLFFGDTKDIVSGDNAIIADPLFKDVAKGDYHLTEKSPARKAGSAWEIAPIMDLEGKVRALDTLGALEN